MIVMQLQERILHTNVLKKSFKRGITTQFGLNSLQKDEKKNVSLQKFKSK